jgi:putative drug exporter of the RND superfamily
VRSIPRSTLPPNGRPASLRAQTGNCVLLKHSGRTLIVAACCVVALAIAGINAQNRLHQTSLAIPGTESAKTEALLEDYFGKSAPFAILLKGPRSDINVQGRRLVRVLERNPSVRTVSPWSRETVRQLRPNPHAAVIFVDFKVPLDEAVKETVPRLNQLLRRQIEAPVHATQSGYASISRAIQDESVRATHRGELIAAPLLLLVLLLVFRSPIAAAIPLVFGAATVVGARGILSIAANWLSIDAFALTVSSMMGLALGVDYALLMVSRFREELGTGRSPLEAAQATRRTAGRTIAFAGGALLVSMITSTLILPGTFLVSLAGGVVVVTAFSLVLGVFVVPSLLSLVGGHIDRWSVGRSRRRQGGVLGVIDGLLRRPAVAALVVTIPLVVLALSSLSLKIGPPSYDQLPSQNPARLSAELVEQEIGPGWVSPYVVLAATDRGPITTRSDLAALKKWQRDLRKDDGVLAVIGPGALAKRTAPLHQVGQRFFGQGGSKSQAAELQELGTSLGRATRGVTAFRSGISRATYGADLLAEGSKNVEGGAQGIAQNLASASSGSGEWPHLLHHFIWSTGRIRWGQHRAGLGALKLKYEIEDLIPRLRHSTLVPTQRLQKELAGMQSIGSPLEIRAEEANKQLSAALLEFQRVPPIDDPHYAAAVAAVQAANEAVAGGNGIGSLPAELQVLNSDTTNAAEAAGRVTQGVNQEISLLDEARSLSAKLYGGLGRLEKGSEELNGTSTKFGQSASPLIDGLPRLSRGATALAGGTEKLAAGNSSLAQHLGSAYTLSQPLEPGLQRATKKTVEHGVSLRGQTQQLRNRSPGIFNSGYFALAALDGAPSDIRSQVGQAVDVDRGGQAARIVVIPKWRSHTAGSVALDRRLRAATPALARLVNGTAGVAGGPAALNDYAQASKARLPVVIAMVSLVTFIALVLILRALLIPALTVLLNLLSVAVAFGVLALLSGLPSSAPLGDWAYIDTIGAVAVFAIAFGLSIDYSVFLLVRMREEYDRSGDHAAAVRAGVQRTGRVITGAAIIMVAVFAAFATSSLTIVSQLGIGLTVAILLDATVVRLLLLPALLLMIGERGWWLPDRLRRLLPTQPAT